MLTFPKKLKEPNDIAPASYGDVSDTLVFAFWVKEEPSLRKVLKFGFFIKIFGSSRSIDPWVVSAILFNLLRLFRVLVVWYVYVMLGKSF